MGGWGERRVSRKRAGLKEEPGVDSWSPVMLALGKLRQKYCEVQANLGQKIKICLKNEETWSKRDVERGL